MSRRRKKPRPTPAPLTREEPAERPTMTREEALAIASGPKGKDVSIEKIVESARVLGGGNA